MEISKTVDYIKRLHDVSLKLSGKICFDHDVPRQLYLTMLYISLLELTYCIVILVEAKEYAGIPSLFRTLLESFIDFKNLIHDESYVNRMLAKSHDEWIRVLNQARCSSNPFLAEYSKWKDLDSRINYHKAELDELKKNGYGPLKIRQCFEQAGMGQVYSSVYNFLCSEVHNDIRALIVRHLEISPSSDDYSVVRYKNREISEFAAHLDSTAGILLEASLATHSFFGNDKPDELKPFEAELNQLRDIP